MKLAIATLAIGNIDNFRTGIESTATYSKKIGCDYFLIDKIAVNYRHIFFEKLQIFNLLHNGYDRVLYLDADVIVTPKAKNIFEMYPDASKFYAYDENSHPNNDWMDRDGEVLSIPIDFNWKKNSSGKFSYFNAGVMLASKGQENILVGMDKVPDVPGMWKYGDQTWLNYLVAKNNIPWESIDYSFNRMDLGQFDYNNDRYNADIIHYAGPCKYAPQGVSKYQQMKVDWSKLNEKL